MSFLACRLRPLGLVSPCATDGIYIGARCLYSGSFMPLHTRSERERVANLFSRQNCTEYAAYDEVRL